MCTVVVVVTESKNIMSKTDRAEPKFGPRDRGTGWHRLRTGRHKYTLVRDCIIEYMVATIQDLIF